MSDTPRTDAAEIRCEDSSPLDWAVPSTVCQEIERELAAVTAERDALLANAMTKEKAREVLGKTYWCVVPRGGADWMDLVGSYSALQLKALAWWMENKGKGK